MRCGGMCLAEERARNAGTEAEQCATMMEVESNKQTDQEGSVFIKPVPASKNEHSVGEIF